MLHRCLYQLAKKKGPPPRRHGLRRNLRRSGSSGSSSTSAARRAGSAAARGNSAGLASSAALSKTRQGVGSSLRGAERGSSVTAGEAAAATVAEGTTMAGGGAEGAPGALVTEEGSHPSPNSVRRPLYRLATAVATVVVPPTTNVSLQAMKHLLTPASPPALASASMGEAVSAATPAVPIVEEYYTSKKGPLFATAVVAGTNAVKQVSSLIPFCYPTPIQRCSFTFRRRQVVQPPRPSQMPHRVVLRRRTTTPGQLPSRPEYSVLYCFCTVATESKAGVEMEALTGATMASVTLYDMLKGVPGAQEDGLSLGEAFVLAKRGGRNDFTKLLMSEPDRPLVESGFRAGGEVPPPKTTAETTTTNGSSFNINAEGAAPRAGDVLAKPQEGSVKPQQQQQESAAAMDRHDEDAVSQRVVRRLATSTAADEEHRDDPSTPGDSGAWWRTSKHEKRLQELYPRRKYGEGARLVPTSPAASDGAAPSKDGAAAAEAASAEEEEEEEEAAAPSKPKHMSKASMIREGRAVTSAVRSKAASKPAREAAAHSETAEEEDDEEEKAVVERRRPSRGQLAKKSGRGTAPTAAEASMSPGKDAFSDDAANDVAAEEAEEVEDNANSSRGNKKGKRSSALTAVLHKPVKAAGKKSNAPPTTAHRRQRTAEEANEDVVDEEEEHSEEVAAEEEEEVVTPARKSPHAGNAAAARRHGKSVSEAAPAPKGGAAHTSRKQRATATATHSRKSGAVAVEEEESDEVAGAKAELDDNDDENTAETDAEAEEVEESAMEGEREDEGSAVVTRRGKSTKHSPSAATTSSKKKGNVMRPVQHSSWDEGTQKTGYEDEESAEEEEPNTGNNVEEEEEEEELLPPPPPPKKKLKKTVRRPVLKRKSSV